VKKQGKRTLMPKLRFPEFRDSEGWQTPRLSDLYTFKQTNTLSRDKLNYETGTIKNIHYGDIHTKFKPLFRVDQEYVPFINPEVAVNAFEEKDDCEEGDIVLADASEDLNDIGKAIEVVSLDGQRIVAGMHTILATRHESVPIIGFGGYLFQSAAVRARIQRESQGTKVYGISANRIATITLPLPPTIQEQQKIADCLSSLDNLIAAEGRKLEALRNHKRGLMQQLFPREGETVPQLRFPEFRDKGEWLMHHLGELCSIKTGKKDANEGATDGQYPFFTCAEDHSYSHSFSFDTEAILVAGNANVGQTKYYNGKFEAYQRTYVLSDFSGIDVQYLYAYLAVKLRPSLISQVQSSAMSYIKLPMLRQYKLVAPPDAPEQQKIADCLSSLDDLIRAQAKKLDALKTHKRGLMQQLFPAPEEQ